VYVLRSEKRGTNFPAFYGGVLNGLDSCYTYIDYILIASSSPEEHYEYLKVLFEQLQEYGIIPGKVHIRPIGGRIPALPSLRRGDSITAQTMMESKAETRQYLRNEPRRESAEEFAPLIDSKRASDTKHLFIAHICSI